MTVLRDDGVDRHLRFKEPGCSAYWFDVITWGGRLYIGGDCGTYVFARLTDMFAFFRSDRGGINPSYWGEKCEAACKAGLQVYSEDVFKDTLRSMVNNHAEADGLTDEQRAALWAEVEVEVFCDADGETRQYDRANEFKSEQFPTFQLKELWDFGQPKEWDFQYLWNCWAIVWAIGVYDAQRATQALAGTEVTA